MLAFIRRHWPLALRHTVRAADEARSRWFWRCVAGREERDQLVAALSRSAWRRILLICDVLKLRRELADARRERNDLADQIDELAADHANAVRELGEVRARLADTLATLRDTRGQLFAKAVEAAKCRAGLNKLRAAARAIGPN